MVHLLRSSRDAGPHGVGGGVNGAADNDNSSMLHALEATVSTDEDAEPAQPSAQELKQARRKGTQQAQQKLSIEAQQQRAVAQQKAKAMSRAEKFLAKYGRRLGQRARRRLYEKVYGREANHVKVSHMCMTGAGVQAVNTRVAPCC